MSLSIPTQRIGINTQGRDYIVGDVHGSFSLLKRALHHIGFSEKLGDRLFHVGDLVDRGEESHLVLDWLGQPWVYSIQGNHEQMLSWYLSGRISELDLLNNGGEWFVELEPEYQRIYVDALSKLPNAIELEGPNGLLLIVHADLVGSSWEQEQKIASSDPHALDGVIQQLCWNRDRLQGYLPEEPVTDVYKMIAGHTYVPAPKPIKNRIFLETGGWAYGGHFSFYDVTYDDVIECKI